MARYYYSKTCVLSIGLHSTIFSIFTSYQGLQESINKTVVIADEIADVIADEIADVIADVITSFVSLSISNTLSNDVCLKQGYTHQ